jgi:hypothetical protein
MKSGILKIQWNFFKQPPLYKDHPFKGLYLCGMDFNLGSFIVMQAPIPKPLLSPTSNRACFF